MEKRQLLLDALSIIAVIMMFFIIAYVIKFREDFTTAPCDYIEEHTNHICVPDPAIYECACGKYTVKGSYFNVSEFNRLLSPKENDTYG